MTIRSCALKKSAGHNRRAVSRGASEIRYSSVSQIPWPDGAFDLVTAFETVYFWPDFVNDLITFFYETYPA